MSDTATYWRRSVRSRVCRLSRGKTLAEEPESAKMLRHIGATGISPARPPSDFLETLRRSLMAATRASRISGLSRRELQYTPWLLWNGDPPAASLPGLLPVIFGMKLEVRGQYCGV